jgi:hypothetical protein
MNSFSNWGTAHSRLHLALNSLDAVHELCVEAANGQPTATLAHVGADNLASLLGLIVDEMRAAQHDLESIKWEVPGE